jgi:transcriptional regulator with XRE-family HTH domain
LEPDQLPSSARWLKELREASRMFLQALAMAAGVSISIARQLEQGSREDPRLSTVIAMATALGIGVNELAAEAKRPVVPGTPSTSPAEDVEDEAAKNPKPKRRRPNNKG